MIIMTFETPFEDWDLPTLRKYMAWKVIEGITRGEKLESVTWEFPTMMVQWCEAQDKKKK